MLWLAWSLLILLCIESVSCDDALPVQPLYAIFPETGATYRIFPNDTLSHWIHACGDVETHVIKHIYNEYNESLSFFLDFSPGSGRTFVALANISTLAIAFQAASSPMQLDVISENIVRHNVIRQTILVPMDEVKDSEIQQNIDKYRKRFIETLDLAVQDCPTLVSVRYFLGCESISDLWMFLQNSAHIMQRCHSAVYLDSNVTEVVFSLGRLLQANGYKVEVRPLCFQCDATIPDSSLMRRLLLIATWANFTSRAVTSSYSTFIEQILLPDCQTGTIPTVHYSNENLISLDVPLQVVLPSSSATSCLLRTLQGKLHRSDVAIDLTMLEPSPEVMSFDLLKMFVLQTKCSTWEAEIVHNLTVALQNVEFSVQSPLAQCPRASNSDDTPSDWTPWIERVRQEMLRASSVCYSRVSFLNNQLQQVRRYKATALRLSPNGATLLELVSIHYFQQFKYYQAPAVSNNRISWFPRAAYNMEWLVDFSTTGSGKSARKDEQLIPQMKKLWGNIANINFSSGSLQRCGEQLWCGLTAMSSYVDVARNQLAAASPSPRFLLYQPTALATAEEFARLLEDVITMMQLAQQTGRVLILDDLDSMTSPELISEYYTPGFLAKWRVNGCARHPWECIFHSIHMPASEELSESDLLRYSEIVDRIRSPYGDVRQRAPRVLTNSGSLTNAQRLLLQSPDEVVVYLGRAPPLPSITRNDPSAYAKLAPFARWFMRPQPWVQRFITKVVTQAVVSPVNDSAPSGELPSSDFPKRFVTLCAEYSLVDSAVRVQLFEPFMDLLQAKFPDVFDVLVITDNTAVLGYLTECYPNYRFHNVRHFRQPYLNYLYSVYDITQEKDSEGRVISGREQPLSRNTFADQAQRLCGWQALKTLAEFSIACEGEGLVGSAASPGFRLLHMLHKSRGDGGGLVVSVGDEDWEEVVDTEVCTGNEISCDATKWERRLAQDGEDRISKMYALATIRPSDIFQHMPLLRRYAATCRHIIECGVRDVTSSWAFLQGLVEHRRALRLSRNHDQGDDYDDSGDFRMVSIDLDRSAKVDVLEEQALAANISFTFHDSSDLETPLEITDMVFIDTLHVYAQLVRELYRYAPCARKYILMHDTAVDGLFGEVVRMKWNITHLVQITGFPEHELTRGLMPAVWEFLAEHTTTWRMKESFANNNGLTVLERIGGFDPLLCPVGSTE